MSGDATVITDDPVITVDEATVARRGGRWGIFRRFTVDGRTFIGWTPASAYSAELATAVKLVEEVERARHRIR